MIYVFNIIDDSGYHADYCGTKIYEGPKMEQDELFKLIKQYKEEFDSIFTIIYDYFVYKYATELHKIQDIKDEYDREDYEDWIKYYIDCEIHEILIQILKINDDQHMFKSEYADLYVKQKLCNEHGFKKNVEYEIIIQDLYDDECCC